MSRLELTRLRKTISVVNDGAVANAEIGEGRFIPAIVLDCSEHRDFLNLIYIHSTSSSGDTNSTWGYDKVGDPSTYLFLDFTHPADVSVVIEFCGVGRLIVADGIMEAKAVYLQPVESGQTVTEGLDNPRILVEVAGTKPPHWDRFLLKQIAKRMRREGLTRKQSLDAAPQHLERMREVWKLRHR